MRNNNRQSRGSEHLCDPHLAVTVDPAHAGDPVECFLLGVHLDDGESGNELLSFDEWAVRDRNLPARKPKPGARALEPPAATTIPDFTACSMNLPSSSIASVESCLGGSVE